MKTIQQARKAWDLYLTLLDLETLLWEVHESSFVHFLFEDECDKNPQPFPEEKPPA